MGRFLIHIDAQDAQDFFRRRLACVPGHPQIRTRSSPESASPAAASGPDYPVHPGHRFQFIVLLDGSAQSRGAGARLAGKREFPKGDRPAFREVARRIPPTSPSGRHPRERGRPARMLSLRLPLSFPAMAAADRPAGGNRMGPAEAEAGRRCRLIHGGDGRSRIGRDARAPGWATGSRDKSAPQLSRRSISPRAYSCSLVVRLH